MKRAKHTLTALDRQSYHLLADSAPELLKAIEADLAAGLEPDAIYRQALESMGEHRRPMALRIAQAARYALRVMAGRE